MTDRVKRPYLPSPGPPANVLLASLTVTTAAPTAFLLREQTPPAWLTAAAFAILLATVLLIPTLNRRAPATTRAQRSFTNSAIAAAILLPLALLYPTVSTPGLGWLVGVGVGTQAVLLVAVAIAGRPRAAR